MEPTHGNQSGSRVITVDFDRFSNSLIQNAELLEFVLSKLPESERGGLLNAVGMKLLDGFERTGSIADLDRAITTNELAVASTPSDHANRAGRLNNLGTVLQRRFECTKSMDDLDRAITTQEQAIASTPDDHPSRATYLNNLGIALQRRFEPTGSMDDLDRAIAMHEQATASIPDDNPKRAGYLNNLGKALQNRFERIGSIDDLNRAITINKQAIASAPDDHPNRGMYLNNLANALQNRFRRNGSMDDLDQAITTEQQAIAITPHGHPDREMYFNNMGNALQSRFQRTGSEDDLDLAILMHEQAVVATSYDHSNRAGYLSNLGNALQSRFERTASMDDLNRAITMNKQAVASTPNDHPDRRMYLNNLGIALQHRFERSGSIDDLNYAITTKEQAIASTPNDHPDRGMYLNNLGTALQRRFERTGSTADLDRAITTNEQAVASTPDDHPNRAGYFNNLGTALQRRFERTGSMDDLDYAITTNEQAVASTPDDHPNRAGRLNNLATALQCRFERTGSMDDLNRAITTNEQAVASTPDDHPNRATCFNSLGIVLQSRFQLTGSMDDLNRAIITNEQSVASTPDDHPNRAGRLSNLGNALHRRFERTGSIDDLNRAIMTKEEAVASTPHDYPDRGMYLNNLGNSLQSRFQRTGSMGDLNRAIMTKEHAVESVTVPPSIRLKAAGSCSDLLINQRYYHRAKSILETAVQLLPMVSPRQLKRRDQQFNISQFTNIASRAVSLHLLDAGDPYKSLQLLELGRGILANLQLEVRSDISVLAATHKDLAKRFQELRDQIDTPSRTFEPSRIEDSFITTSSTYILDSQRLIAERKSQLERFDELLRHIRSLQGFENFLQCPSMSELHSLAEEGPIVVFNVSDIRSDAFLITTDEIHSIPLPSLTADSVEGFARHFFEAIDERGLRKHKHAVDQMNDILRNLWDFCVNPILDKLGFTRMPHSDERWPRIWWVGSGLLNVLPIHASGYHDSIPPQTALDRVISSYAPTIKSLAYARERAARADQITLNQKAILIAMPTTPEKNSLSFVETEINDLENLFSEASIYMRIMRNPTRMGVLSELSQYNIVHFACHGHSADDPSQSSLLLEDWRISPLTVLDLTSLNLDSAKFAYLSACHASAMRNPRLLDESISLSSAIQLCGYASVVGSLWQLKDNHSAEVATDIYKWILRDCELDFRRSAEGLHNAVRNLRDRTRFKMTTDPLVWASLIHIGV